jgi:hypothetical protein
MATIREIAQALVDTLPGLYFKGCGCPLCGYDGAWPASSEAQAVDYVVSEIERSLRGEDRDD